MSIPAIILARAGSKGIPDKNLQEIEGQSLVGRCVREAVKSLLDPVFVWSDSERIYNEGLKFGASECPSRPKSLAADDTTSEASVLAFLQLVDPTGEKFKEAALLQCTTPFIRAADYDAGVRVLQKNRDYRSVVTVTDFHKFLGYPETERDNPFIPVRPYRAMRQDSSGRLWMENGGMYLARRGQWHEGRRIGRYCGVVEMPWWRSIEIDEPVDLEIARAIAAVRPEYWNGEESLHE